MDRTRRGFPRRWLFVVAALVITGVAAGCGSSSSSNSSAAPKLTKAEFLRQGNAICRAGNAKTDALAGSLGPHATRAQVIAVVERRFVPAIQSQITQIRALAGQTADKSRLASMLDLAQTDLNKVKADPAILASGKPLFQDFANQAHAYGLRECAKAT